MAFKARATAVNFPTVTQSGSPVGAALYQNIGVAQNHTQLVPLELVMRPTVTTAEAALYLNRRDQTLRSWAVYENGPIKPLRICGRLAWPVSDLKRVLGLAVIERENCASSSEAV